MSARMMICLLSRLRRVAQYRVFGSLERAVFGLNRGGIPQIGEILIQPAGWAEASQR